MKRMVVLVLVVASTFISSSHAEEEGEGWQYVGHLYKSLAVHRSVYLRDGYVYRFHLTEATWNLTPHAEWYNRVYLETTEGEVLFTFNEDLTPYEGAADALAVSEAHAGFSVAESKSVTLMLHHTIYQDHLSGYAECDVYRFPADVSEEHNYDMQSWVSPGQIPADGSSSAKIWVQLYRDGIPYRGQDGSEETEYIKITTDKGSFWSGGDEKETWMFYNSYGCWIPLYADDELGVADVTLEWHGHRDNPIIQHVSVRMGEYSLAVTADPVELAANGTSTAAVDVAVEPYTAGGGDVVTLTTSLGTFSNGSDTIDVVLNSAGTAEAIFIAPSEIGYCHIHGQYVEAEDTARIMAQGATLQLVASPNYLPANSDVQATCRVKVLGGDYEPLEGVIVLLTTNLGLFENGSKTIQVESGWGAVEVGFHPEDGKEGVATIQAECNVSGEGLSDDDEIRIFNSALWIQCDPSEIEADGESQSEVTVSLFLAGEPASGGQSVLLYTDAGSLTYEGTTASAVILPIGGGGTATAMFTASDEPATALLTAEYVPEDLTATDSIVMSNYQLTIEADSADYHSVSGTSTDDSITREFPDPNFPPEITSFGLTKVPVVAILSGPDVGGKQLLITSVAGEAVAGGSGGSMSYPPSVYTDGGGRAEFTIQVENLYKFNADSSAPITNVDISAEYNPKDVSASTSFELVNNLDILLDAYRTQIPPGPLHAGKLSCILDLLKMHPSLKYAAGLAKFGAGGVTNILSNSRAFSEMLNHWTCGGCQAQTMYFLDDIRVNRPDLAWLLNGLDYGPLKQLNGAHNAAVIWPTDTDFMDVDRAVILDFWASQNPTKGTHTWEDWLESVGFPPPTTTAGRLGITAGGSSSRKLDRYYPTTGADYPEEPIWDYTSVPDAAPKVGVILDCPVNIMITDGLGRQTGFLTGVDPNDNPLLADIPGIDQYPFILDDSTKGWFVETPAETNDYTLEISGYDSGQFNLWVVTPTLDVIRFVDVDIADGNSGSLSFDPAALEHATIYMNTGTAIMADRTSGWGTWEWNSTENKSTAPLTVTNLNTQDMYGPLTVYFEQISPNSVTVENADGEDEGRAYFDLSAELMGGVLGIGESIEREASFHNPDEVPFEVRLKVVAHTDAVQTNEMVGISVEYDLGFPRCGDDNYPYPAGDLNGDCMVDLHDLTLLGYLWMKEDCQTSLDCLDCDITQDGLVNLADVVPICENWLADTGP